jgi:hypothetical protein
MTEAEREELIKKMAKYIACASSSEDDPTTEWCDENWPAHENQARAALTVAEPVIREWCADIARNKVLTSEDCCEATGAKIAAAIREGGNDDD